LLSFGLNLLYSSLVFKNLKIKTYRTIILSVVLYGCETWLLTLREERRLRRIFGPKKDEVTEEWRKLRNEELNDLYCSPNIVQVNKSKGMRWTRHIARMGRGEAYTGCRRGNLRDTVLDGRVILRWILRKWGVGVWTGSRWLRIGTGGGHL